MTVSPQWFIYINITTLWDTSCDSYSLVAISQTMKLNNVILDSMGSTSSVNTAGTLFQ